jgi:hypothetical protein
VVGVGGRSDVGFSRPAVFCPRDPLLALIGAAAGSSFAAVGGDGDASAGSAHMQKRRS